MISVPIDPKLIFLIQLQNEKITLDALYELGFDPTWSILDAEAIILFGGLYCCEKDPGYILLKELTRQYPNKTFYIVKGNSLHDNFKQNANIIYSRDIDSLKKLKLKNN